MENDFFDECIESETKEVKVKQGTGSRETPPLFLASGNNRASTTRRGVCRLSDNEVQRSSMDGDPEDYIATRPVGLRHLKSLTGIPKEPQAIRYPETRKLPAVDPEVPASPGDRETRRQLRVANAGPRTRELEDVGDPEDYISTRRLDASYLRSFARQLLADTPAARMERVVAYAQGGSYHQARRLAGDVNRVLELDATPIEQQLQWQLLCGVLAIRGRDFQAAEEILCKYRQTARQVLGPWHPSLAVCERYLGVLYRLSGRYEQALTAFSVSLRLCQAEQYVAQPGESSELAVASVLCSLGHLERSRGNFTDAVRHFARARERYDAVPGAGLHPGLASTLYGLGSALLELGQECAAVFTLARAYLIRTSSNATALQRASVALLYGHALWLTGEFDRAYGVVEEGYHAYRAHPEADSTREAVFVDWFESHDVGPEWSAAS